MIYQQKQENREKIQKIAGQAVLESFNLEHSTCCTNHTLTNLVTLMGLISESELPQKKRGELRNLVESFAQILDKTSQALFDSIVPIMMEQVEKYKQEKENGKSQEKKA